MIASLRGIVVEKLLDTVVIEVNGGVGYDVAVTAADYGSMTVGDEAHVYIYEAIREDAYNLFGFSNRPSRDFYKQLLTINGIGPKVAMNVLSAAPLPQLQQAIATTDPELLRGVAGIGKKTAERIMMELKGKVVPTGLEIGEGTTVTVSATDPVYEGLVGLGYTAAQAASAISKLPSDLVSDEERLKAALKQL